MSSVQLLRVGAIYEHAVYTLFIQNDDSSLVGESFLMFS